MYHCRKKATNTDDCRVSKMYAWMLQPPAVSVMRDKFKEWCENASENEQRLRQFWLDLINFVFYVCDKLENISYVMCCAEGYYHLLFVHNLSYKYSLSQCLGVRTLKISHDMLEIDEVCERDLTTLRSEITTAIKQLSV